MIQLEPHARGVILPVKAQAGARHNRLAGEQAGALKVSVTQAPEKGKANKAIIELLAESLALRKSKIELVSGETSPQKKFLVTGIEQESLAACIEQALSSE